MSLTDEQIKQKELIKFIMCMNIAQKILTQFQLVKVKHLF